MSSAKGHQHPTELIAAAVAGDHGAADRLLEAVYDELRMLAASRLRSERPGQTLSPTALVHEAYLRLGCSERDQWNGRGHFFSAAAEAMRRILVERARARRALKRGGDACRLTLDAVAVSGDEVPPEVVDLDDALARFTEIDPQKANLVKLRFFAGLTLAQTAAVLGISEATADRHWAYARAWLYSALQASSEQKSEKG